MAFVILNMMIFPFKSRKLLSVLYAHMNINMHLYAAVLEILVVFIYTQLVQCILLHLSHMSQPYFFPSIHFDVF